MNERILAIGDIHGCLTAFETLLSAVQPQPEDTFVTLGDYVDRGPDSRGVLARLIDLGQTHHLVALRGNHEEMMLRTREDLKVASDWLDYGGDATLASYGVGDKAPNLAGIPLSHWTFLEQQCIDCWETDTHFFVHANVYPDIPLAEQPPYVLHWARFEKALPHQSGKIMICGHTSQKSGLPANRGFAVCIDTWVYGKGWLSCLDVTSGLVWQANQEGQQRQLWLQDLLE
jgi:serine/threonine protein phosphatase 1